MWFGPEIVAQISPLRAWSARSQEEEKNKIQNDLRILTERLSRINESLARKVRGHSWRCSRSRRRGV